MSFEHLSIPGVITSEPENQIAFAEQNRHWPTRLAAFAVIGAITAAGGLALYEWDQKNKPGCNTTITPDGDGSSAIQLPDGTTVMGDASTKKGQLTIFTVDGLWAPGDFKKTLTSEEVKAHPTIAYDATKHTQVLFHVTEHGVTTSCAPIPGS